jgi:S1-C subfamily serine protease
VWLTAAHVVENCSAIFVEAGLTGGRAKRLRASRVTLHPSADVAIIETPETDYTRRHFALAGPGKARQRGSGNAYHIGFPRGKPGAVHSRFLGHKKLYRKRRRNAEEEILVWAQITRLPDFSGSLGGISGGVVLDETGAVIGTNSAESARRGRILTSRPKALWETVRRGGQSAVEAPSARPAIAELNPQGYPEFAKYAIQDRRIIRVICSRG